MSRPHNRTRVAPGTVVVFGAGRSGTTWLAQIVAAAGMELIFEPLNRAEVPEAEACRPVPLFAPPGEEPPWAGVVERALAGELRNEWTVRDNPGAPRRVVKLIRANLIVEWIVERFPVRPVFIVRNPLSVVASMMEQGWVVDPRYVRWAMRRPELREAFFEPFQDLLRDDMTQLEAYTLFWCLQNYPPMARGVERRVPVVRFERLARDPEAELHRLAPHLGFEVTTRVLEQARKRSFMASARAARPGYDPTTSWRELLSDGDRRTVEAIVRRFGLERYLDPEG